MRSKAWCGAAQAACLCACAASIPAWPLAAQETAAIPVRSETRTEALAFGGKLRVRNRNGDIAVTGWDREEVNLAAEIRDSASRKVDLTCLRTGSDLDIEAHFQQPLLGLGRTYATSARCRMILHVPKRIVAYFRTTNGGLAVTGLEGYVRCETTNGDISLAGIAGEVAAETSNGNVEARGLHARIRGGTSNGRILLEDVDGQVSMLSSNGSIQARNLDGWAEGISLECTNGPIEVELGRATGDLTASSVNGTVKVQVAGTQVQESGRRRVRLRIPGRDQKIILTTTNGDIQVH
jgi:DUF4097 and DUF4098 domain-containing protein YvlB